MSNVGIKQHVQWEGVAIYVPYVDSYVLGICNNLECASGKKGNRAWLGKVQRH